jgi:hypothetical protein
MKESTLIQMQKEINSLKRMVEYLFNELNSVKDLAVGASQLLKLMPNYDEAIEQLKVKNEALIAKPK